jgi:hypothetical protein
VTEPDRMTQLGQFIVGEEHIMDTLAATPVNPAPDTVIAPPEAYLTLKAAGRTKGSTERKTRSLRIIQDDRKGTVFEAYKLRLLQELLSLGSLQRQSHSNAQGKHTLRKTRFHNDMFQRPRYPYKRGHYTVVCPWCLVGWRRR